MTTTTIERLYKCDKVEPGLYVLQHNDGKRQFVIAKYSAPGYAGFWTYGMLPKGWGDWWDYEPHVALEELHRHAAGHRGFSTMKEAIQEALAS